MPTVSCVITSYNNEQYLEKAIMSVLSQTRPPDELIVADDCSTDGSRELIAGLMRRYRVVRALFRERNVGVAANRDLAIRDGEGDLVTTLDGDDWYFPQKIEQELATMDAAGSSIAHSDFQIVTEEGQAIARRNTLPFSLLDVNEKLRWTVCRLGPLPRDVLLSKSVYLKVGGFRHDLKTYEDWDFKIRLVASGEVWAYSGVDGVAHRSASSGLSSSALATLLKCQIQVLSTNRQLLLQRISLRDYCYAFAKIFTRGIWRSKRREKGS